MHVRVRVTVDADAGLKLATRDGSALGLGDDHALSAPEPCAARVYDLAPQRAVPRLGAHSPLLDSPSESTRFEGRAFDAIPR